VGESAQLMQGKIEEAIGGVLFIDEAYFLSTNNPGNTSPQKQCLNVLIQAMENRSDELTVIFAGYQDEIEKMMKSNPSIASRVPYKFIFEDYSVTPFKL
jgi:predicted ATP-dependent protease